MNVREAVDFANTEAGVKLARDFLDRPRRLENRLTLLYARMDALREKVAPGYRMQEARTHTGVRDKTGELAARLCDTERETRDTLSALAHARRRVQQVIADIDDESIRQALTWHFIDQMTTFAGAARLYLDERQYRRKLYKGCRQVAMRLALEESCTETEKML